MIKNAEIAARRAELNAEFARSKTMNPAQYSARLEALNEEFEALNAQAREFEKTIAKNVAEILGA